MATNKHHTHITSKHHWYDLNLREVWQYRDLIWLFTQRNFVVKYKQTVLGPAWIFLSPLISSIIYAFVFGGIAGIGTDGIPSILFYLAGNAIWTYFSTCVTQNASTFTANAGLEARFLRMKHCRSMKSLRILPKKELLPTMLGISQTHYLCSRVTSVKKPWI
jgi:hypothetical protein